MRKPVEASKPSLRSSRFIVGQDAQGLWVVFDRLDIIGGLFANRDSAVHFAMSEANHDACEVYCVPNGEVLNAFAASFGLRATTALRRFRRRPAERVACGSRPR